MNQIDQNTLFYGDNLKILRDYIPDESVDLIYLDPPFNSNRSYNVLFKDESGQEMTSQIRAFEDTWHWVQSTEETLHSLINHKAGEMLSALCQFMGKNQMTAYLVMMTVRLIELHRVLKPTGSLYLHCDPTASHYLKIVLDCVFGVENFRNEITWKRRVGMSSAVHTSKRFGSCTDIILFYSKTENSIFNVQYNKEAQEYQDYVNERFTMIDENGRKFQPTSLVNPAYRPNLIYEYKGYKPPENGWMITKEKMEQWDKENRLYFPKDKNSRIRRKSYADELKGMPIQNFWTDIVEINSQAEERLGYPTQKPVALLERIIKASSNENDIVLDPFCGCGTAIIAAQQLKRRWIGIDITHLSIALQKYRLKDSFNLLEKRDYKVIGQPEDLESARQLAGGDNDSRYQFQWWALSLIKAMPLGGETGSKQGKKGSDKGIDGFINFIDEHNGKFKKVIVQVKSGKVKSGDVRDLIGVVQREQAAIGVFITLESPSRDMKEEAVKAGFYLSSGWNQNYPKIQILTIEELLNGQSVQMPPANLTFKVAPKGAKSTEQQGDLL